VGAIFGQKGHEHHAFHNVIFDSANSILCRFT
jgi:hypothetical protein